MITLAIDASTAAGSVAVLRDAMVIAEGEAVMRSGDREFLLPAIQGALARAGLTVGSVDRIVCGAGPGSFTSLRIAGSIAKGIAHARGIPLLAVSSLALLVAEGAQTTGTYVAAITALRGEHYVLTATVGEDGGVFEPGPFELIASGAIAGYAAERRATLIGAPPGRPAQPHARSASRVEATMVNLASWEPAYGRLAEAQVKWEASHGRPLDAERHGTAPGAK